MEASSLRNDPRRAPEKGHYTWADFIALPDDDRRELVDGELIEVELPTFDHETVQTLLVLFLAQWARKHKAGRVVGAGYKVRVTKDRGAMPDVQFFRNGNIPPHSQNQGLASGRPDLAVEIISPGSAKYDRVTKREWYKSIGVPEYWIVSGKSRTLDRMILRNGRFQVVETATNDDMFRPETFPGLEIPLTELWDTGSGS